MDNFKKKKKNIHVYIIAVPDHPSVCACIGLFLPYTLPARALLLFFYSKELLLGFFVVVLFSFCLFVLGGQVLFISTKITNIMLTQKA